MAKEKILREYNEKITYSKEEWALLKSKRKKSIELLKIFTKEGFNPFIYGSVARGNVHYDSDIDIVFTRQIPSFQIEIVLSKHKFKDYYREIIMATPRDPIKLYIHLSELECISLPLSKLGEKNIEFYDFGGKVDLNQLKSNVRVSGVDKRLVLIRPTLEGHDEISIIHNEPSIAKELRININIVNERVHVLLRREKHGRTGVFLKRALGLDESPEEVLRKLAKKKSIVRKRLFER